MKKLSLVLAALLVFGCLAGCSPKSEFPSEPAATLGDAKIDAESFYNYFSSIAASLESGRDAGFSEFMDEVYDDSSVSLKTYRTLCEEYALESSLVEAIVNVLFDEADLKIEPADEANVTAQVQNYITQFGGEEAYEKAISEAGMSRSFFERSLLTYVKIDKLTESLRGGEGFSEEEMLEKMKSGFVRVKHILIKSTDDEGNELDAATVKSRVDDIIAQLDGGADFETLMALYGEDPGMESYKEGYVIDESVSFDAPFISKSFELAEGEYGAVDGVYGTHIIKRYPLETVHLKEIYPDGSGYSVEDVIFYGEANTALVEKISAYQAGAELVRNEEVIAAMVDKYIADNPFDHTGHDHADAEGTEPEGTEAEGTAPEAEAEGTAPEAEAEGTAPEGTAPEGTEAE